MCSIALFFFINTICTINAKKRHEGIDIYRTILFIVNYTHFRSLIKQAIAQGQ
jgi:hypothetical protein